MTTSTPDISTVDYVLISPAYNYDVSLPKAQLISYTTCAPVNQHQKKTESDRITQIEPDQSEPAQIYYETIGATATFFHEIAASLSFAGTLTLAANLLDSKGVDACYNLIFKESDRAFQRGQFDDINQTLSTLDVLAYPIDVLLAFFTITKHAKNHLPNRTRALQEFENRILKEQPDLIRRCTRLK